MAASEPTVVVCIEEHQCTLDKVALLDLMILVSERHGRVCEEIAKCGDIKVATELSTQLEGLNDAHGVLECALADLEESDGTLPKGESHGRSKLTQRDVDEIRQSGESNARLADRYCVSESCIKHVRSGRTW